MSTNTPNKAPLNRDAIVATALAIGDREGIEAISLRRIATALGVTPMALYRYVENKEALLDAVADLAYAEVELPDPDSADWWEGLASIAHSVRRVLTGHPAAAVVASRSSAGPNTLRILERILALLRRAGFDIEDAVRVQIAFTRFTLALIALEAAQLPELTDEERRQKARRSQFELESLPADDYPNLIQAAPYLATPHEPERTFAQALGLLKAGIESQLRQK